VVHEERRRPPVSVGGILAVVGGAVIVASTLFEVVSAKVGPSGTSQVTASRSYLDTDDGKVVAALGVVVLVLSLATLVRPARSIVWPIAVVACSLAALGMAIYDRSDLEDTGSAAVHVSAGPALYVAIGGGVVATIGALLASRDR
jgi:hypothetical protein